MTFPAQSSGTEQTSEPTAGDSPTGIDGAFEGSNDEGFDWGEFGDSFDSEGETPTVSEGSGDEPAPAQAPEAPVEPAAPASEPAQPAAAEPPQTPPTEPQQPTQPQTPDQGQQPQQPQAPQEPQQPQQPTQEQYEQQVQQAEAQWRQELAQSYALSEDEATMLQESPAEALPQLAATMHMRVTREVFQSLQQNLPNWVNAITQSQTTNKSHEDKFFEAWPELKEHTPLISQVGQMYRQMNPQATPEDFIKNVGAMVWAQSGLPLDQLLNRQNGGQQPTPPSAAPQGEVMGTVNAPVTPAVHPSPAAPSSHMPAAPVSPSADNEWAALAESLDQF